MLDIPATRRFADLLLAARASGTPLSELPDDLVPSDAAAADAVQFACADALGPIGGFKVLQVADRDGGFGFIPATNVLGSPAAVAAGAHRLKIELEIAFRVTRDLPGRADGAAYTADEAYEAIGEAFAAFEILETRLPPGAPALAARADAMTNWGLVTGPAIGAWKSLVRPDVAVKLTIAGKTVVDAVGGHPSGDPAHALPWLATALARAGRPLRAGQVITTGAFGGGHPIVAGDVVTGTIAGFAPIAFRLEP